MFDSQAENFIKTVGQVKLEPWELTSNNNNWG